MAVDTRSKRASVLGLAISFNLTLPLSDGTMGQADRQHVAYCYAGLTASAGGDSILGATASVSARVYSASVTAASKTASVVVSKKTATVS